MDRETVAAPYIQYSALCYYTVMDTTVYEKLLGASLRFVSYRPRSEKEIRDFLTKKLKRWKVFGGTVEDKVIARLTELGYVDDTKFAEWWVEQRRTFKPKGAQLIRRELQAKGINKEIITNALAERYCYLTSGRKPNDNIFSEKELAEKAIQKKLPLWTSLPPLAWKQKVYSFLGSRGFDSETIASAIDDITEKE